MLPEVKEAIRIADQHLAGEQSEKRSALAKDIIIAINSHAGRVANEAISTAFQKRRDP